MKTKISTILINSKPQIGMYVYHKDMICKIIEIDNTYVFLESPEFVIREIISNIEHRYIKFIGETDNKTYSVKHGDFPKLVESYVKNLNPIDLTNGETFYVECSKKRVYTKPKIGDLVYPNNNPELIRKITKIDGNYYSLNDLKGRYKRHQIHTITNKNQITLLKIN